MTTKGLETPAAVESLTVASSIVLSDEDSESIKVEGDHTREVVGGNLDDADFSGGSLWRNQEGWIGGLRKTS